MSDEKTDFFILPISKINKNNWLLLFLSSLDDVIVSSLLLVIFMCLMLRATGESTVLRIQMDNTSANTRIQLPGQPAYMGHTTKWSWRTSGETSWK